MTAPTAFLVDANSTITPHVAIAVNASTGAPSFLTVDAAGNPVTTSIGGGGGSGNVTNVGTFANTSALQVAFPAAANLGAFANVGASAPYAMYQSNGTAWGIVGGGSGNVLNVGTFANVAALQSAFPAAANVGAFGNVGASAPYTQYQSSGAAWLAVGHGNVLNVGTYATAGALQTAFPAASNTGALATVGSSAPYTQYVSNGSAWVAAGVGSGNVTNVGTFATTGALQTAFPAASNTGSLALVGSGAPYALYISSGSAWIPAAGGAAVGSATPQALGTASAGTDPASSHQDHVHAMPTALQTGGIPQSSGDYNAATNTVLTGPFTGQNLASGTLPTGSGPAGFRVTVPGNPGLDSTGQLGLNDLLFYSTALVWDVAGGAAQTTNLYKGDGTTTGRLIAAVPGLDYNPGPLWQSGVPIGVMPNCTIASGGAVTITGANTPTAYPQGCWMWYSANALYSGSAAGWWWTVLAGTTGSTASSITVYNSYLASTGSSSQQAGTSSGATLASGFPVPVSPTTTGITGGTHTQPTATVIYVPGPTVPANYMGNNGSAEAKYAVRNNNTGNGKAFQAGNFWAASNPSTVTYTVNTITVVNNGTPGHQFGVFSDTTQGASTLASYTAIDTTANVVSNPRFNFSAGGAGNDWQVCEFLRIMVIPRA